MERQSAAEAGGKRVTAGSSAIDICYIAVFTAIIAIMAQISIPLPGGVPLTLQTLAVPLAGIIIGTKRGALSTVVYVLLGAFGVPVFAGLKGGLGIVLGMTGGFLVSFPLMAIAAGIGMRIMSDRERPKALRILCFWGGLVAGAAINYAVGTVWFMAVAHTGLMPALTSCVIPFIPTAVIKIILAGILGPIMRGALLKAGVMKE